MRTDFKHDIATTPSFARATPTQFLREFKGTVTIGEENGTRTIPSEKFGGHKPKAIPERTSNPLNMVFITRTETSSPESSASACGKLARALTARGHRLLVLECDQKRKHEPAMSGQTVFYGSVKELKDRFSSAIRNADLVILASNVPEGSVIGEWITRIAQGATAFYDLDTTVTLRELERGESEHLSRRLIRRYQLYLSFTGGPLLELIGRYYGAPMVRPLYGFVDTSVYYPEKTKLKWDLGYAGIADENRLPGIDELLLEPARRWADGRFVVARHGFSQSLEWPDNVKRGADIVADKERAFYNAQRFALNVTGAEMIEAGFSPSLHIFEAAACGTPIISDYWEDLETFFAPDEEILFARSAEEVLDYLRRTGEDERLRIGDNARHRILAEHSAEQRAIELESYALEAIAKV